MTESYGYDEFGCDLYQNQGTIQPFGYTGYQYDKVTGTYFAQAREYWTEIGRFISRDMIKGYMKYPITFNEYVYCWNNSGILVDLDGKAPKDSDYICTGECSENNIAYSNHECSRINEQIYFHSDSFKNDIVQPSIDEEGLTIVGMESYINKQGFTDDKGFFQWGTEIKSVFGEAKAGAGKNYIGLSAKMGLLSGGASVRIIHIGEWDIHIGVSGDLFAIGGEMGIDLENGEAKIGLAALVGGSLYFKWSKHKEGKCDKE